MVPETTLFYIGLIANVCSLTYRIPQIYKLYQSKSGNDISNLMLIIQNISYALWIIYSLCKKDYMFVTSCTMSFLQNLIIWRMAIYYNSFKEVIMKEVKID